MARIGGRSTWLAVPAGLLCVGVVAGLVWLALPMVPVSVTWVGDTLRAATLPPEAPPETATPAEVAVAGSLDCRQLYPDGLWAELSWHGGALLSQTAGPPATAVTSLAEALAPTSRVTCTWRLEEGGAIVTTLAAVAVDAAAIADAALRGQGFECTTEGEALRCQRVHGQVVEEHAVRGGLWLSSMESTWHPEEYGARVAAHVWGTAAGQSPAVLTQP